MRILIISCLILLLQNTVIGQSQADVLFSYDNCTLSEDANNPLLLNPGIEMGGIECTCGVAFNAMGFDGVDDCAELDGRVKDFFAEDFSFSFYFFVEDHITPGVLFSIQNDCGSRDSTFVIKYDNFANELSVTLSQNIRDIINFKAPLKENKCWHHFTLVKEGEDYLFYYEGEFQESKSVGVEIVFGKEFPVLLANSPCVDPTNPVADQKFHGKIDEFKIFQQVLSADEVDQDFVKVDQILNGDTTIFEGNSVQIEFEGSCANTTWDPTTDLSNTVINPISTPTESRLYNLTMDHGTCIARDSIKINVVFEDDIDCSALLLPNAFTPNGDGLNEGFGISNLFIIEEISYFEVYDRWGAKIFETNEKNGKWDGSFDGQKLNPGMFVYKIEYTCQSESYRKVGNFSLLR